MEGAGPGHVDRDAIDLFWIPLGAGGVGYIRFNGRVYEAAVARAQRRRPRHLYHTALRVIVDHQPFVIENAWPSPDADTASRGVVTEGPVFSRRLARFRALRYEVRRWRDGVIPDAHQALGGPQRVSRDPEVARRLLASVEEMPPMVWGRDEAGVGEMWNSNSTVAWLLARSGVAVEDLRPPPNGRAPGWEAGLAVARRSDA
jgi:hypothetical protein